MRSLNTGLVNANWPTGTALSKSHSSVDVNTTTAVSKESSLWVKRFWWGYKWIIRDFFLYLHELEVIVLIVSRWRNEMNMALPNMCTTRGGNRLVWTFLPQWWVLMSRIPKPQQRAPSSSKLQSPSIIYNSLRDLGCPVEDPEELSRLCQGQLGDVLNFVVGSVRGRRGCEAARSQLTKWASAMWWL